MPTTSEKDLPDKSRALWLKAISAVELRNYGYAISLIANVLKDAPAFLDGRRMLRKAAVANTKGKKQAFLSGLSTASLKGGGMVKKDPKAAMELAEKTLENDPYNRGANDLLKEAARAAGFPEVAAFALETLVDGNPKDTKLMHELGEQYTTMGEADKAVQIFTRITEINPADMTALKKSKDAAARATMKTGGWEGATSYRDVMKNKDQAVSLEQASRVVKDEGMIDAQLVELSARYEAEPQSVDVVRKIAGLWEQKQELSGKAEDLEKALEWFKYCLSLTGGADPAIARKVSDLEMHSQDVNIKALEDWFAAGGDQHEEAEQYRDQLAEMKRVKAESLIGESRKRVERNPTDLQLRFELGERLLAAGLYDEAINELQRAQQNPNVRLRAMSLLGRAFVAKGMLDMAASRLETAAAEMVAMDNVKKDTLYELTLLYEKMSQKEKYIQRVKEIAEVDYTYKDIAQRMERLYSGS